MSVLVVGSGTWGVALAHVLADNNVDTTIWSYEKKTKLEIIEKINSPYFNNFSKKIQITYDFKEINKYDHILLVVPSFAVKSIFEAMILEIKTPINLVIATKGIEKESGLFFSDYAQQFFKDKLNNLAVLAGPTHAEEVIQKLPTLIVAVSENEKFSQHIQNLYWNKYFRVYRSTYVKEAELGSSIKNVYAIGVGITQGIGYGDNIKAAAITRAIHEMHSIFKVLDLDENAIESLTILGDLIVTASSIHSRNYQFGFAIGSKKTPKDAEKEISMVVEGKYALIEFKKIIDQYQLNMPIIEAIYQVVILEKDPQSVIENMFHRERKNELGEL